MSDEREVMLELIRRTRLASGVPEFIEDEEAIAKIVRLMDTSPPARPTYLKDGAA